jgi:hypothetical protein
MPRMTQAQALPPLTKDLIEAFAASAVAWAVRLLGAVLHPRAERRHGVLTRFVRRIERFVEHIIFLKAVDRAGPPPQRRHAPRSTPPGFRRVQRRLSLFWKIARIRAPRGASLADRLARLLAVLARPGRYIARFLKELCKGLRLSRLIPLAPPEQTLAADAPRATAFADSS